MGKSVFSNKPYLLTSLALILIGVIVLVTIGYRSYLINSSIENYKLTGYFDDEKLKTAINLKSEYASHLLLLSYFQNKDTINFNKLKSTLETFSDWKSNAIMNDLTSNEKNPSNNNILEIQSNLENEKIKDDWFWIYMKGKYLYLGRNGYEQDIKEGLLHFKHAADLGSTRAMYVYAMRTENKSEQCKYFEMFVKSNFSNTDTSAWGNAYSKLAYLYYNGEGCILDYDKAFLLSKKSANLENTFGLYMLAQCYEYGNGIEKNLKLAFDNYLKSAEKGDSRGIYKISQFYKNGLGVEKNYNFYISYLNKAADKNNELAIAEKAMLARQRSVKNSSNTSSLTSNVYSTLMNALLGNIDIREKNQNGSVLCKWCRKAFSGRGYGYNRQRYNCSSYQSITDFDLEGRYCSPKCAIEACNSRN